MALRIDFSLGGTSGAPRGHIVHTSAVTPCGHIVWTLFLPLLEPYSEMLIGKNCASNSNMCHHYYYYYYYYYC